MDEIVETRALTKYYGDVLAVDGLDFEVTRGAVLGLLGPNGAGKTTIIGMLLGLIRPTSGTMKLFGRRTNGSTDEAVRRIGAIMETPAFYPFLSGRDNLRYFQGISGKPDETEIDRLLDLVGLSARAGGDFSTYSLGMKHRLGIAYALLGDPEVLFLDEPTNGLDPAGMAEVRTLIRRLGDGDRTVVLASHLLNEVEQVCDSVAILSKGRLIAQGPVAELIGGRGHVRVRTTDNARALDVLGGADWISSARLEGTEVLIGAPAERAADVSRTLAEAGIYLESMAAEATSLEQYFLEVTGEEGAP